MKMRYKLLVAFAGVLTVSATVFLLFSYYSLHRGYFSGVSRDDMKKALVQGEMLLKEMDEETLRISRCEMGMSVLQVLEADYKDMDFVVLDSGNWDKEKLGRVFQNLMDNALKYGMDGKKLRIAVEKREQQGMKAGMRIPIEREIVNQKGL